MDSNGRYRAKLLIVLFSFLCWGRILSMSGIWWDDWAWVWHYFGSDNAGEFMRPFEWLKHRSVGYMLLFDFKLFDLFREHTTNIWSLFRFIVFTLNAILIYKIAGRVLRDKVVLPLAVSIIYLSSPVVTHLALVTYDYHVFLFFYLLSVLFSIKSIEGGKLSLPLYVPSVLLSFIAMVSLESFIVFDFLRPLLFLYVLRNGKNETMRMSVRRSLMYWLPFLLTGISILIEAAINPQSGPYAGVYSTGGLSAKLLYTVIGRYIISLFYIFIKAYTQSLNQTVLNSGNIPFILVSVAAGIYAYFILRNTDRNPDTSSNYALREARLAAIFGLLTVVVGLFPYALTREAVTYGHQSRHGLLAAIGASIFFPAMLITFYNKKLLGKRTCQSIFGLLVFLGALQCNYTIKVYKDNWEHQRSIWWQMIWRAPDIKPNTFMIIDMPWSEAPGGGSYVLPPGLNLAYAKSRDKKEIFSHYAYELRNAFRTDETNYRAIHDREVVEFQTYKGLTRIYPKNLIAASYQDGYLYLNDEIAEPVSSEWTDVEFMMSNVKEDRIIYEDTVSDFPYRWILEPELKHDWRYYYQKANALSGMNYQSGIVQLFNEAREKGYDLSVIRPQNLLPFVKAFYLTDDLDTGEGLLIKWATSPAGNREWAIKYLISENENALNKEISAGIENAFVNRQ